jgi:integrase
MPKLTKRIVESTKPSEKEVFLWDQEIRGFGVRIKPSGVKTYIVQYRNKYGQTRRYAIGRHGTWTTENARKEARQLVAEADRGGDPSKIREQDRSALTMAELCKRYIEDYAEQHKKPRSIKSDRSNIDNHVIPLLGTQTVISITRGDIDAFKRAVKSGKTAKREVVGPRAVKNVQGGPGAANRCLALLSKMFNLAEKWDIRPDGSNPCRHIEKYKEHKLERFLSEAELGKLAEVLNEAERTQTENQNTTNAIRLLLFTGARSSEILTLKWEYVDFENQCLRLPDSKTGKKSIYLPPAALEILQSITQNPDNLYVLQGRNNKGHLINLRKPWHRIRKEAGLNDVRIHDLRHSFASMAVAGGLSLPMIGALLGHTQAATTARYAHLAADPLKQAANITGARIAAAMAGDSSKVKANGG